MNDTKHTIYCFAHCETWLEDYAKSNQLAFHDLTERVANLLLAQTSRQISRSDDSVSSLRRETTPRNSSPRKMAMVKRSYRKTQLKGPKAYWAAMSAEDRSIEMKRRMAKRVSNGTH